MAESPLDIDRIVREVIAELGLAPDARVAGTQRSDAPATPGSGASPAQPPATPAADTLVISGRVVTMSQLSGRLQNVRRLVVSPRAVITPAVRDELQRRNVAIQCASPSPAETAASLRLVLVTAGGRYDPTALIGRLAKESLDVESQRSDCLIAATDLLAAEVTKPDTMGLLLARETAAALCLANRHRGVRAVSAADPAGVSTAAVAVGANLLVIDPATVAFHQLKQTITEFCRHGPRPCPEVFRKQLA